MAGTWTVLVGAITYTLGTRIWALGKKFGYITPADLIADFFESEAVRVIVALVSVLFTLIYIQVQAQGLGYIPRGGDRRPDLLRAGCADPARGGGGISHGGGTAGRLTGPT